MQPPLVSVNMPVYNGAAYIGQAIDSIVQQTYPHWELIVVNDASTDDTVQIVNAFKDDRIKLIHNKKQLGLAHVRNVGVAASAGKYIAILDSDDVAGKDRLAVQVAFLESHPQHCLVCSWVNAIDANGVHISQQRHAFADAELSTVLFFHNCIAQSSVMLRRSMLPDEAPYDPAFPPSEDYQLWVRMLRKHPAHLMQQTLLHYRVHKANSSAKNRTVTDAAVQNVLRMQCNELGLTHFTEKDFGLHFSLTYNCYGTSYEYLANCNAFYQQIIKANRTKKIFDQQVLLKMIRHYLQKPMQQYFVKKQYSMADVQALYSKSLNAAFYLPAGSTAKIILKGLTSYKPGSGVGAIAV